MLAANTVPKRAHSVILLSEKVILRKECISVFLSIVPYVLSRDTSESFHQPDEALKLTYCATIVASVGLR